MLSKRENGSVPSGVVNAPVTDPAKEVSVRPYIPITHGKLPAKHRRGEGVGWHQQAEIGSRLEARVHARGEIDRNSACLELAGGSDIGPGRHAGMIIDRRERPTWLLGSRRKASEKAGKPEAHAAFVGTRSLRK